MSDTVRHSDWQVAIHDDIAPLEERWRTLEECGCCTMFQTYDWLSVWYAVTARHQAAEPIIVTASRRSDGQAEVILPLCRLVRGARSIIAFADIEVSDFCGPVFAADAFDAPGAARAFVTAVRAALPDADAIHLGKIVPTISGRANPLLALDGLVPCADKLWGLDLDPSRPEAPAAIPEALLASTNKRRAQLERKFGREIHWEEDHKALPAMFDELVDIRMVRAERIGREDPLATDLWRDFYASVLARRHATFHPSILSLKIDGATIATAMGIRYRGSYHYLLPSFVMTKWSRYTPGFQLILDAMEAVAERGCTYFDFTIGNEPYKQDFGAAPRPLYEAYIALTPRGWLPYGEWRLREYVRQRPRLKAMIRRVVPKPKAA